jgi:(1->4)-alpha-D-glucan 1-alpha-D-glucosylmutase
MRAPRATYRLQFRREFGFHDAAALAPYLSGLGVSHVYASPYLRARPGSTHGYDIVAHDELNPELGDRAAFAAMHEAFNVSGLAQILDFVPNHMGVTGADNPLWLDVLEWGPDSPYAGWFDIDWEPAALYLTEKLLVPVLGDQYGAVLGDGKLELKFDAAAGSFAVWAYDTHKLPVSPLHYAQVLGNEDPHLERLGDAFSALPEWRPQVKRRAEELKQELAMAVASRPEAAACVAERLRRFNGDSQEGDASRARLDALIQRQYWRASHFRVAGDDINYRRFFNINDLAGLRVELPEVFEHIHQLVAQLLRNGVIDGLRIDHIDGLLDPAQYLARLRAMALDPGGVSRPFHVVVEKILAEDERLPAEWQVEGTTGYEFANQMLRLLTDARGEPALTAIWREFSGARDTFEEMVRDSKIFIMKNEMASELNVLARDAARVARQNSRTADFTRRILHRALRATVACFPVYRTYLDSRGEISEADRRRILSALAGARELERDLDPSVFDFLELLLTGALVSSPRSGFSRHAALRCAMKFQQFSGPVMAKGLEDTAFYRYNRLISHNEVGGDPRRLGGTLQDFHDENLQRQRNAPASMLGTSTHDTKRGEDVRMRLVTLAEIPEEWSERVRAWHRILGAEARALDDASLEYFFYQTLLGSYPVTAGFSVDEYRDRLCGAMTKAAREARHRTSWARPNEAYEACLTALVGAALASRVFMDDFEPFQQRVARAGAQNSLVQTVLKLTLPGVPDIYQGAELWDLSLVDPDNRRPVDYGLRQALLSELLTRWEQQPAATLRDASANWQDGRIKLLLTAVLLRLRADNDALVSGEYVPCEFAAESGSAGFLRRSADSTVLVTFRRFPLATQRGTARSRIELPKEGGPWQDVLRPARGEPGENFSSDTELPVGVYLSKNLAGLV